MILLASTTTGRSQTSFDSKPIPGRGRVIAFYGALYRAGFWFCVADDDALVEWHALGSTKNATTNSAPPPLSAYLRTVRLDAIGVRRAEPYRMPVPTNLPIAMARPLYHRPHAL